MMKILKYASNTAFYSGAAIAVYVIMDMYILRSRLPSGVCPVTSNRPLIYASIILCLLSFVLSYFEPNKKDEIK